MSIKFDELLEAFDPSLDIYESLKEGFEDDPYSYVGNFEWFINSIRDAESTIKTLLEQPHTKPYTDYIFTPNELQMLQNMRTLLQRRHNEATDKCRELKSRIPVNEDTKDSLSSKAQFEHTLNLVWNLYSALNTGILGYRRTEYAEDIFTIGERKQIKKVADLCSEKYTTYKKQLKDSYNESLNEDINSDFLPKDIKLINRELERNNREVSKLGFSTNLLADEGLISVYVPDKTYNSLVKEIVNTTAKNFGYKSELENESSTGDILFSFHRADNYGKTFRSKEVEDSKQRFEDTIKTYGIDYETALAIILDEIDNKELDFITKEIRRRMNN